MMGRRTREEFPGEKLPLSPHRGYRGRLPRGAFLVRVTAASMRHRL